MKEKDEVDEGQADCDAMVSEGIVSTLEILVKLEASLAQDTL